MSDITKVSVNAKNDEKSNRQRSESINDIIDLLKYVYPDYELHPDGGLRLITGAQTRMVLESYRDVATTHGTVVGRAARGTRESPSALQDDDEVLSLNPGGHNGTDFQFVTENRWRALWDATNEVVYWATSARVELAGSVALTDTTDASLSTDGALLIGPSSGVNITIDQNEILARNNGSAATLFLQMDGGSLSIGANTDVSATLNGNTIATEQSGSFNPTFTGFSADPSGANVYWSRAGQIVTMVFDFTTGTSNATTFTISNVPSAIQPSRGQSMVLPTGIDSGSNVDVITAYISGGTISFGNGFQNPTGGGWTNSGFKGLGADDYVFIYKLD